MRQLTIAAAMVAIAGLISAFPASSNISTVFRGVRKGFKRVRGSAAGARARYRPPRANTLQLPKGISSLSSPMLPPVNEINDGNCDQDMAIASPAGATNVVFKLRL
jgi:hypothetical protein